MVDSKTIIAYLEYWAKVQPQKDAIVTETGSLSYEELWSRIAQLAYGLAKEGMKPHDNILLFMPNCAEYAVAFYAAVKLKLNIIPANASCKESELRQLIEKLHPQCVLVADEDRHLQIRAIDKNIRVIYPPLDREDMINVNTFDVEETNGFRTASIYVSTSGSTGTPKYIVNTYKNELLNAGLYLERLGVKTEDVVLSALPVTQRFGMAAMLGSCLSGCTLVLMRKFNAETALQWICRYGVTVQYGVPTIYIKEKEAYLNAAEKPDISSLRTGIIAGASSAEDVFRWFDEMGCRLLNCYGTSEIGGLTMAAYTDSLTVRSQTCGHAFSGAHIEVLNAAKEPVHTGETGEIVCTTPWMMRRYEGEPKLTAKAFDEDGRFLTGDIGYMDAAGNLTICGRKKELIIRGGYNVFPAEVEQALTTYTDASEACVIGYKDTLLGERICAFVKLPPDVKLTAQDLREQLMPYIAKYKLPDRVILMDDIPKLPNGKNDCPALQASLAEQLDNERKTVDQK